MADYELSLARGAHRLIDGERYEPESLGAGSALGGTPDSSLPEFEREERRQRMLAAALDRLRVEEEELEQSCGTSGPGKITPPVSVPPYLKHVATEPEYPRTNLRSVTFPNVKFTSDLYAHVCGRLRICASIHRALHSIFPRTPPLHPSPRETNSTTRVPASRTRICPHTTGNFLTHRL